MSKQVTYTCQDEGLTGSRAINEGLSFKCDGCGITLLVDAKSMTLGANGRTAATLRHNLLSIKEIGKAK